MKRTLLLTSAAVALTLGLTPAFAQDQDNTNSKMKRDPAATVQHDRDVNRQSQNAKSERDTRQSAPTSESGSSRNAENKGERGSRSTTGQADNEKATPKSSDTNTAASKSEAPKSANGEGKSEESKRAEDRAQKPSGAAATNKSGSSEPSKNAEQNSTRSPAATKSTQTNERNRNAQSQSPSRNTAETKSGSEPKERATAKLDPQKKSQLTAAIDKVNAKPLSHVDFSVSVGTAVPRTVELRPVPTTIVDIVPQYRGYDFFVVRDDVVIVEPHTHKIVDVIERGPTRARAETTRHVTLSKQQREVIHRHATSRRTVTTGAAPRTTTEITVGETLPDSVEVESFPEEVYREVPEVRQYRYIERGDDVYLVDPSSRRVIEEVR